VADDGGAPGNLLSTVLSAKWAFSIKPVDGWGPRNGKQQATAGWLSALPVFEPHWQARQNMPHILHMPLGSSCSASSAFPSLPGLPLMEVGPMLLLTNFPDLDGARECQWLDRMGGQTL
jgi:hypothetical protein